MFICLALLWCVQYWENWYLNKRILRFILQDFNSPYESLLSKVHSKSLYKRCLLTLLIILYKSLFFTHYPGYPRDMFSLWSTSYSLCSNYINLCLYHLQEVLLNFMVYTPFRNGFKTRNSLPDSFRTSYFPDFKCNILQYDCF